ncbi:chemotaxis protein MotC [Rhizobiaceae bacterium n13]|uniref:Chemotaxis protein MotC n=1 Tax=Ferirhizobium litorale TaxID=2927786 RepID=A0AAE3QF05_9HYPH|nr:chemotaxis protein MotC [Fererhizobium litorale]MDI7863413.1 chemotaxis protein MotC [Fererhizobium litorale]MDI7922310.1 chemotaxis protein MotC [Fererhizobium litorale]
MARKLTSLTVIAAIAIGTIVPMANATHAAEGLAPYKMMRSLQFVQDQVILGDHSAAEMQRYLLATFDERLRTADTAVFDDPRNVDAALIYAMSGGNPETLDYLASRDIGGTFDNRLTDVLRKYLNGKGTLVAKTLGNMALEYKDTKIGPYLALVSANSILPKDRQGALKFYDLARLGAPGTIIEESALRRSISIAASINDVPLGLKYSSRYSRRFLHSPYASQFADLFVHLVVDHFGEMTEDDIVMVLSPMDNERQKEVYLRIARKATIQGKTDLARLASIRAQALSGTEGGPEPALAALYGGFANIPTEEIGAAMRSIIDAPEEALSKRDRALRDAARAVAEEVLRAPDPSDLTETDHAGEFEAEKSAGPATLARPLAEGMTGETASAITADTGDHAVTEFRTFISTGRSKLDEIDTLLNEEGSSP